MVEAYFSVSLLETTRWTKIEQVPQDGNCKDDSRGLMLFQGGTRRPGRLSHPFSVRARPLGGRKKFLASPVDTIAYYLLCRSFFLTHRSSFESLDIGTVRVMAAYRRIA